MTHQSRICAVFFDTESDYDDLRQYWSAALGREAKNDSDEKYTTLSGDLEVLIQDAKAGHQGMHIDIIMLSLMSPATKRLSPIPSLLRIRVSALQRF
jgi:hypothetical protein